MKKKLQKQKYLPEVKISDCNRTLAPRKKLKRMPSKAKTPGCVGIKDKRKL